MKKLTSFILALVLCLSLTIPAFAYRDIKSPSELNNFKNAEIIQELSNGFIKHTIKFPTIIEINQTLKRCDVDLSNNIECQGKQNINTTKSFIRSLNLNSTLENAYIQEIENIGDGYLDSCTIYEASKSNNREYYGTYNGRRFYTQPGMSYSANYCKGKVGNMSKLNSWISGAINLVMNCDKIPTPVSIAFSCFDCANDLLSNGYTAQSGDYAKYYARCKKHLRNIVTYDSEHYIESDYCPCIEDGTATIYPYVVYHCDKEITGYSATVYEYDDDVYTLYSDHYRDKKWNLRKAYEKYDTNPSSLPWYFNSIKIDTDDFTWSWENS